MRLSTTATVAALSPLALAAPVNISGASGTADIIVRKNMGGVAGDHSDTRILVPLGRVFAGHPSLDAVSTLWLNAAYGVDVATVTCTPFKNTDGTGEAGPSFSKEHSSYVSTHNDNVGSIFCS
ncbi:hypothetical protein V2G26_018882 [Clonostachys chloroleuca]|uniref:Uncharacterized protein n=1 Tax=Clonostachys chloroleuca TaxID=1926264 RepID=A0AA35LWM7_9HYPO|nr:unnamed protein product [Clonostachys chloroleuca]